MKDQIRQYVDSLFADIIDTKQLHELKEEISANLLDKINDYIAGGDSREAAFQKAVSSLGDMSELIESLKKASASKVPEESEEPGLDKKHVMGYVTASGILLVALMKAGMVYLKLHNLGVTIASLMPMLTAAVALFIYFGLTQENKYEYGMQPKRALTYTLAAVLLLVGISEGSVVYFAGKQLFQVVAAMMPLVIPAVVCFIYLGLTEKSRAKRPLDSAWQQQWVQYYSNPQAVMLRGNMSGALWIFSIAAFFIVGLTWGWKFSWIVFIVAVGCEVLFEAFFTAQRKH